jgi:hypothetical protein
MNKSEAERATLQDFSMSYNLTVSHSHEKIVKSDQVEIQAAASGQAQTWEKSSELI